MTKTNRVACRNCGASLTFSPGTSTLTCPFCGTVNEIEGSGAATDEWGLKTGAETNIVELDYRAALAELAAETEVEESETIRCPGCGVETTFDEQTLAENCAFCGTPLARAERSSHRHPKPQGVLPFALTEREAKARMQTWLHSLWFAPSKLKTYAQSGRNLSGIYLPHFTYDAIGVADYRGQRGDAYHVTVNHKSGRRSERRIRWRSVSGRVRHDFDDVLVPASEHEGSGKPEYGGRSWDLAALEDYRTEYFAGFRAEMPTLALDECFSRAREVMEDTLRQDIRRDIGGDEQRITSMQSRFSDVTFKHVLLPVWLASYRFQGKVYQVTINGRTGQVTGKRPYSAIKIAIAVLIALILAGLFLYFAD